MSDYMKVHRSDLEKVRQVLDRMHTYLRRMNEMNAALHMSDPVYSPLTGNVAMAMTRVDELLDGQNTQEIPVIEAVIKLKYQLNTGWGNTSCRVFDIHFFQFVPESEINCFPIHSPPGITSGRA